MRYEVRADEVRADEVHQDEVPIPPEVLEKVLGRFRGASLSEVQEPREHDIVITAHSEGLD